MIEPRIIQVCMTHDGRVASVLYDDGRAFLFQYTKDPSGRDFGEGVWTELNYPKFHSRTKRSKPTNAK